METFKKRSTPAIAEEGKEKLVCKIKKNLYVLKKAPREWYYKFHLFMLLHKYHRNDMDHCLYMKKAKYGSLLILNIYVDNMLIARTNMDNIASLKSKLNDTFDMKDLGGANQILGMCIVRNVE